MDALRVLGGLAVLFVVVAAVGSVVSLVTGFDGVQAIATAVLLVGASLVVVGAGVDGAGGTEHTDTPYW